MVLFGSCRHKSDAFIACSASLNSFLSCLPIILFYWHYPFLLSLFSALSILCLCPLFPPAYHLPISPFLLIHSLPLLLPASYLPLRIMSFESACNLLPLRHLLPPSIPFWSSSSRLQQRGSFSHPFLARTTLVRLSFSRPWHTFCHLFDILTTLRTCSYNLGWKFFFSILNFSLFYRKLKEGRLKCNSTIKLGMQCFWIFIWDISCLLVSWVRKTKGH